MDNSNILIVSSTDSCMIVFLELVDEIICDEICIT